MSIYQVLADRAYSQLVGTDALAMRNSEAFDYIKYLEDIYKLLQSESYYSVAVRELCFACEVADDSDSLAKSILQQCIKASRIFLYEEMLRKRGVDISEENGLLDLAQNAFYSIDGEILLTKEQKDLFDLFMRKRRLVVSAPTSFGKSRIVREIITHCSYNSIAVVVPTNALLSETYQAFREDVRLSEYGLIFSTHIEPPEGKVIYIFTPEKFDVYTDEHKISYDFFVFDEVYKVDAEDRRSSVFSNCLYKAYLKKCDYYLIGPYFKGFSKEYLERTDGHFVKFETDIVQKETVNYYDGVAIYDGRTLPARESKDARLTQVLSKIDGQSIVYVGRKDSAETRAKFIAKSRKLEKKDDGLFELIEYIKKNISSEWHLIDFLKVGVAFHHAGVPKYIQSEIVDLFNAGVLDVIVCTPTLTEGVNTSAKNVIFYDTTKADIALTGFEVKNVVGRSGRFGQHFIGRAIFLESHEEQRDMGEIFFPIFDYDSLLPEDNIQISYGDLSAKAREQREEINSIVGSKNVPIEILRQNKYVPFDNQLRLIEYLRSNPDIRLELKGALNPPNKRQVDLIIELVHEILFADSDKRRAWSTGNISRFVKFHIYHNPSIKQMIKEHSAAKEDTRIRNVLDLVYTYFEYALPKYIKSLENIYNFVYHEKVSFSLFITRLQYGSTEPQDILLADAGLPRSIISVLSDRLSGVKDIEEIRRRIRGAGAMDGLSNIEKRMLKRRL
ncbi:helicase-related protein [Pseudomonas aeruginosa]